MNDSLVDLIAGLNDIIQPEPVSMFPQTLAWLVLTLGLGALALYTLWRRWQRWKRQAYRRHALAQIKGLESRAIAGDRTAAAIIASMPRRVALQVWPRGKVASVHGHEWLAFLGSRAPRLDFDTKAAQLITQMPYAPPDQATPPAEEVIIMVKLVRDWVEQHVEHHRV